MYVCVFVYVSVQSSIYSNTSALNGGWDTLSHAALDKRKWPKGNPSEAWCSEAGRQAGVFILIAPGMLNLIFLPFFLFSILPDHKIPRYTINIMSLIFLHDTWGVQRT